MMPDGSDDRSIKREQIYVEDGSQELARVRLSKEITIPFIPEAGLVRVQVSGGHLMRIYNTIPFRPSR
jgi:hypothetical protein